MADARVDETVYIPVEELPGIGDQFGNVGVVGRRIGDLPCGGQDIGKNPSRRTC